LREMTIKKRQVWIYKSNPIENIRRGLAHLVVSSKQLAPRIKSKACLRLNSHFCPLTTILL